MMIRSLAMVLPTLAFVLTTDPTDLGDSLAQTFKLPARFVLATIAALRLVGILFAEWNALGQARRARGLGAGQSLLGRAQTFGGKASPCSCRPSAVAPVWLSPWRRAASVQANAPGHACPRIRAVTCT